MNAWFDQLARFSQMLTPFLAQSAPEWFGNKDYFNETFIHPLAAMILAGCAISILMVPRRYAVWPYIFIVCFITQAQRINIATLDFTFLRLMVVFAALRVVLHGEMKGFKWNRLDFAVLAFMGIRAVWSVVMKKSGGNLAQVVGAAPSNIQTLGETMDMIGIYFFLRFVVRDFDDLKSAVKCFMFVSIPTAIAFIYEYTMLENIFGVFREMGKAEVTRSREGQLRCMGPYSHPILAGVFWAVLLPYFGAMIKEKGRIHILPLVAIVCAAITILASGSSTPIAAAGVAFMGGCLFLFRRHMRLVRWGILGCLVLLQLVMAKGAWFIFARLNIIGGSTGYYRFKLIDQFISHANEWFLAGSSRGTESWSVPMYDVVNYYVVLGLSGGILFLLLIAWCFWAAFKNAGEGMRSAGGNTEGQLFAWATGVAVFTHMISFMVVTYYGQVFFTWYFALAVTAVRAAPSFRTMAFGNGRSDPLARLAARQMSYPPMGYPQPANFNRGH